MPTMAKPGLLAAFLLLTVGAAPSGTSSPHWPSPGARSAAGAHAVAPAKFSKPRLPTRRMAAHRPTAAAGRAQIPTATRTNNAVFNGLNKPGMSSSDNGVFQSSPPDTTGSIGPNHYVETINSVIGVYNRSDLTPVLNAKASFNVWLQTGGTPFSLPLCDPQIQWDESSQRWLYVVLECNFGLDTFLYGWSKTPDPSDLVNGWCRFSVSTPGVLSDYPKLGHSSNYMLVGTNNYSDAGLHNFVTAQITWMQTPAPGVTSCTAPVVGMTNGSALNPLRNGDGTTFTSTPVPVNTTGNAANGYVISAYDAFGNGPPGVPQNKLTVFHLDSGGGFHLDGDLSVTTYAIPSPAPNPGGSVGIGIDTLDGRLTQAVGDPTTGIYTQHTVQNGTSNRSKVTWYEIQVASSVPTLTQQGDISSTTDYVFNGAISPRGDGKGAVIFYNRVNGSTDPVIATQGRMVTTALGQMDPGEIVLATSTGGDADFTCGYPNGTTTAPCRWGDYAGASADPLYANVVWGSNQALSASLPGGNPNWVTQNFAIAGPTFRTPAAQSTPRPTPTRGPVNPGPTPTPGIR
ncbi:MAG TPA: hypothetical protein VGJ79_03570 [Candidatus Dormibacteraeota bacterium]